MPNGVLQNLDDCRAGLWPKVQCDVKSTNTALQTKHRRTGASGTSDPNPELCSVHYLNSTTTERLDSFLHPLPVMRSAVKRLRCVSFLVCASLRLPSLVWCGLCALGSDSQTHSHSALPLGAVWDQRVQRSQQQVLHFCSHFHPWGFSQSERQKKASRAGQMLLRWSTESTRL